MPKNKENKKNDHYQSLSMTIAIISIITLCIIAIILLIYERIACREVCAILCNSLSFLDQLCGLNDNVLKAWRKYGLKFAANETIGYYENKKVNPIS